MVFPNTGNDEFEVIKGEGPLFEYRCRTCGSVFHMHPKAVQVGIPCPDCAEKMNEADIFERYMKRLGDGQYEFANEKRTMLRHKVCGGVVNIDVSTRFWADMECQECQKGIFGIGKRSLTRMKKNIVCRVSSKKKGKGRN